MVSQYDVEKLGKKLFGENDVEDVLQRLDRLTRDEAQATAAQTLKVVYGLIENLKSVMDSELSIPSLSFADRCLFIRLNRIEG
jgi:hypothetical protein